MFKVTNIVAAAAAIAAVVTLLTSATAPLDAGPLAGPAQKTLKTCTQRPWPYLNCVGTAVGDRRIRLVTTDRLVQQDATIKGALAVNTALAHIYRSGEIAVVFKAWFNQIGLRMGLVMQVKYAFGALQD